MEETSQKKDYTPPSILFQILELECGVAAGSAMLKPGDSSTPEVPKIDDWRDTGTSSKDFDF